MQIRNRLSGMPAFTAVWGGQFISMLGSIMTDFAILIWLWTKTGQATPIATFSVIATVARICAAPLVSAVIDRWDRKFTMAISDLVAGTSSILALILYSSGQLEVWHLYVLGGFSSFFGTFQFPAFSAAITLMVSKKDYARATGMNSISEALSGILAPILAAGLIGFIGLKGILVIDICTFAIAVSVLLLIKVPKPVVSKEERNSTGHFWKDSLYGFTYLYQRKSLFALLLVFLVMNLALSFSSVVQAPLILARSGNSQLILSGVQSVGTIGALVSGLLIMVTGGPKNRIRGLFLSMTLLGFGVFLRGSGTGFLIWAVGGFITAFAAVGANACSQAFWQAKVAPEVQGRVFTARSMIGGIASPLAMIISGPLADRFFEPAMTGDGLLVKAFSWLTGTGTGAGFAVMFLIAGSAAMLVAVFGYTSNIIRNADLLLPDHDAAAQTVSG